MRCLQPLLRCWMRFPLFSPFPAEQNLLFFFSLLPGDPAVCLFPLLLYQLKDKTCFCFHKDFLLKCRCQKYGPRGTAVELRMIIEGGDYFSFSIEHSESSLWLSGWGKHKNPELRGVGTEKKCCFHFKTLLCILSFSKWVLSRAILNILGILGGRPDQALLYFILIFFQTMVVLFVFECKLFFSSVISPRRSGSSGMALCSLPKK